MEPIFIWQVALLILLLVASAFFSGAETALFCLNRLQINRMMKERPPRGAMVENLMAAPTNLLSTLLIGNTLVNVAAAALGFAIADRLAPGRGEAISIPAMTVILLLFGEVTPKRLAIRHAAPLSLLFAPILSALVWLFAPIRLLLDGCTRVFRRSLRREKQGLSEDEFLYVVGVGHEEGVLDQEERTMVDGIIRLEETQASDVMTPRVDVLGIDLDDPEFRHREIAETSQFRYLPVFKGSLDHPVGFLDVPRFLLAPSPGVGQTAVPPFFVPETAPLDSLLSSFQRENCRIAFVTDEYGGTAGIITRGDILAEIASDVDNEYSEGDPDIKRIGENKWLIEGNTSLEDVNYELDLTLSAEGAGRLAGWISARLERIPKVGDSVEGQGCRATVRRMRSQRIVTALVERLRPLSNASQEQEP